MGWGEGAPHLGLSLPPSLCIRGRSELGPGQPPALVPGVPGLDPRVAGAPYKS